MLNRQIRSLASLQVEGPKSTMRRVGLESVRRRNYAGRRLTTGQTQRLGAATTSKRLKHGATNMEPPLYSPKEYSELLEMLADGIQGRAVANPSAGELTHANWALGHRILTFQHSHGWGGWLLNDLAADLQSRFGARRGLSLRNLQYMRACAQSWPHQGVDRCLPYLPWGHITVLLDKLGGSPYLDWYAQEAAERPWTRTTLTLKIRAQAHRTVSVVGASRAGSAP